MQDTVASWKMRLSFRLFRCSSNVDWWFLRLTMTPSMAESDRVRQFRDLPRWIRYIVVVALAGLCALAFGWIGLVLFFVLLVVYLLSRRGLY